MKRILALTLCIIAVFCVLLSFNVFADDTETAVVMISGTCGKTATWELDTDYTLTIKGEGAITSYSYTAVPWYTFSSDIKKIVVEKGITTIPSATFRSCTSLEEIELPFVGYSRDENDDASAVFGYIFGYGFNSYSSSRSDYTPPAETTYQYYVRSSSNYSNYYYYYYYYIPQSLRKVTITDDATIPYDAFCNCSFLREIILPETVTSIGGEAFYNCSGITSINFADTLKSLSSSAFSSCTGLTDIYFTGSRSAYLGITNISQLNGITPHFNDGGTCGTAATWETTFDDELWIKGEGTVTTGTYLAYYNLVKNINIGSGITSVSGSNFSSMTQNTAFTVDAENENYKSENGFLLTKDGKTLMAVPVNAGTSIEVPYGVEIIGSNAIEKNTSTEVTIPETVKEIQANAFRNSSVTSIIYAGTSKSWSGVSVASGNDVLSNVIVGKFVVTYDLNDGEGSFPEQEKVKDEALALYDTIPQKTGCTFVNWKATDGTTYAPGASYTANAGTTMTAQWTENEDEDIFTIIPGDVNGDGRVDRKDLNRLAQYFARWEVEIEMNASDANGDGRVDRKDLNRLAQYFARWEVELGK